MDQLASKEVVDHILSHHGIKGMKWGSRKGRSSGPPKAPAHPDAVKAHAIKQVLDKSGSHALSNEEIRKLTERQNLEQQLVRLNPKPDHLAKLRQGNQAVGELLKTFGNVKSVHAIAKAAGS